MLHSLTRSMICMKIINLYSLMNINHDCIGNDHCEICTVWQLSDCSQVQ